MTLKELIERPIEGVETVLDLVKGDDGTKKVVVSQRRLLQEEPRAPKRSESPARAHHFYEVRGFINYLKKFGGKNTVLFADPGAGIVEATLDESAANGRETVGFRPMLHPQWKPWDQLLQHPKLSLAQFLEHCANNRRGIVEPNARDLVLLFSQIQSSSKVEMAQGQGKNAVNGVMVTTTIKGIDGTVIEELPDIMVLNLPIYVDTLPTSIEIDLTLSAKPGEGVFITLAAGDLLEAKHRIFSAMCAQFDELKDMTVTMGSCVTGDWDYIEEKPQQPSVIEKTVSVPAQTPGR